MADHSDGNIPVSVFFCRSIRPTQLAEDFTLHAWRTACLLVLSLLVSSFNTSIIAMGGALEGFDIREQREYAGSYAMSVMNSKHSPGPTRYSHTTFVLATRSHNRAKMEEKDDANGDQMPTLSDGGNRIVMSKTFAHNTKATSRD